MGAGKYNISFMKESQYQGIIRHTFNIDNMQKESLVNMGNIYLKAPEKREIKKLLLFNKEHNQTVSKKLKTALQEIYFQPNKYQLSEEHRKKLLTLSDAIKKEPKVKVDIIGYPDLHGFKKDEMDIAFKRAKSTEKFLLEQGVSSSQLNTLGRQRGENALKSELGKVRFQIR